MKEKKKRKVCLEIPLDLFRNVNLKLVEIYGNSFGYFTKTVEIGLKLWLDQNS